MGDNIIEEWGKTGVDRERWQGKLETIWERKIIYRKKELNERTKKEIVRDSNRRKIK